MGTMANGHQLEEMIRDKVERGVLPRTLLTRVGGGLGAGELCSACGKPVTDREPIVHGSGVDLHGEQVVRFHIECYYLWVEANRKRPTRASNSHATEKKPSQVTAKIASGAAEGREPGRVTAADSPSQPEAQ